MAPCFWLITDCMISIKDMCVFPCCHNNAVQRGIIAAPPAQANQIYCLTAHHKTKVKNIDLILMHVSFQKNISQLRKSLIGSDGISFQQRALSFLWHRPESSVESLISRYEVHFDKHRQRTEERAHQEMYISGSITHFSTFYFSKISSFREWTIADTRRPIAKKVNCRL